MKKAKFITLILLTIYIGVCVFFFIAQRHLIFLGMDVTKPSLDPFNEIIETKDGTKIKGWLDNKDKHQVLIFFGGNAMSLSPMRNFLNRCTNDQYAIYLFPYLGYEGQQGSPSEKGIIEEESEVIHQAMKDHPKQPITLLGVSLGTGVAVQMASHFPNGISKLILIEPYDSIENVAKVHYPWLPVSLILKDKFNSLAVESSIKAPVYILRGNADTVVPKNDTAIFVKHLPIDLLKKEEIFDGNHNDIWNVDHLEQVCGFINDSLNTP